MSNATITSEQQPDPPRAGGSNAPEGPAKERPHAPHPSRGAWRSERHDRAQRKAVVQRIATHIRGAAEARRPGTLLGDLPHVARTIEASVYLSAPSLEAYTEFAAEMRAVSRVAPSGDVGTTAAVAEDDGEGPASPHQQRPVGRWRNNRHIPFRSEIIKIIAALLGTQRGGRVTVNNRTVRVAKSVESMLYLAAPSFGVYRDASTLKRRVQRISIGTMTRKMGSFPLPYLRALTPDKESFLPPSLESTGGIGGLNAMYSLVREKHSEILMRTCQTQQDRCEEKDAKRSTANDLSAGLPPAKKRRGEKR